MIKTTSFKHRHDASAATFLLSSADYMHRKIRFFIQIHSQRIYDYKKYPEVYLLITDYTTLKQVSHPPSLPSPLPSLSIQERRGKREAEGRKDRAEERGKRRAKCE